MRMPDHDGRLGQAMAAGFQPMSVDVPVDTRDRDRGRACARLQDALDRHGGAGALVERVNPETAEGNEDRRRQRDKGGEPERTHRLIVSTAPDGRS
jgi:hypothetical protein